ncbi:glucosamine-phosphate N-acetyltransferase [Galdieria sulphuraria]|uniref:Glucosamine 6-phosphate N-acetyltransferase n=1 Tax=Galdieria sulphuraria TaxID=130081 RepID=M2XX54_GALSU|nr:glucosamine-phosphate N-acetyltransferase [Galdieria sulphuraria]EME28208.1 glucosamine-phosphate N-acetyltransferase [Galdieria sulphuraria]|eukprot:XP_005704728.1 glucosamine-phosphate N-acetyltransferase [Galdieria sulphuraria]
MSSQENIIWRTLSSSDFDKGYTNLLSELSTVGSVEKSEFLSRLHQIQSYPDYYILVAEDVTQSQVIASGTLLVELKFLHNCKSVGHIEDIVVSKLYRGLGLGKILVDKLVQEAKSRNCYKVILSCSPGNVAFYEKCNFVQRELQMVCYFNE